MTRCTAKNSCKHHVHAAIPAPYARQDAQHNVPSQPTKSKACAKKDPKASQAAQLILQKCSKRCPGKTKISSRSILGTQNWGPGGQVGPQMLPRGPRWRPRGAQDLLNGGQEGRSGAQAGSKGCPRSAKRRPRGTQVRTKSTKNTVQKHI